LPFFSVLLNHQAIYGGVSHCFYMLANNKWPLGIDPGGHHFVFLNVSINNKPFFVSAVVVNRECW